MKLTTKGRFAVTAMIDVALYQNDGPVSLSEVADRNAISLSYLEQLFRRLRQRNLVSSTRGPGGGYRLARDSSEISIADIVLGVDEPVDATNCGHRHHCGGQDQPCMTHELWSTLTKKIVDYLASVSVADLVDSAKSNLISQDDRILLRKNHRMVSLTEARFLAGKVS